MRPTAPERKQVYHQLNSELAYLTNAQIEGFFSSSEPSTGWGRTQLIQHNGIDVFVKRIPLAPQELSNIFSSKNHYQLPTFYNYGVGSVGFGVGRELLANIKATNWVLNDQIAVFPLLYHYRVIPFWGEREQPDPEEFEAHIDFWAGDQNLKQYLTERSTAEFELILFLEHVPHTIDNWLIENPEKTPWVLDKLLETAKFLQAQQVIHFDINFSNVLTDGSDIYLTDFGLVLDKAFELTPEEHRFFDDNSHYDFARALANVMIPHQASFNALPDADQAKLYARMGVAQPESLTPLAWRLLLSNQLEVVHASAVLDIDQGYFEAMIQARKIFQLMIRFYTDLMENERKDNVFQNDTIIKLLREAGAISR